jgi:hypothetical protein
MQQSRPSVENAEANPGGRKGPLKKRRSMLRDKAKMIVQRRDPEQRGPSIEIDGPTKFGLVKSNFGPFNEPKESLLIGQCDLRKLC